MPYLEFFSWASGFFRHLSFKWNYLLYHLKDANVKKIQLIRLYVLMFEDFPMYYSFISPLKSSYFKWSLKLETKVFTHGWPCDYHMRVLCMHTRLGLRSVLGLRLALGSYRVYHTSGRMLILHRRYSTPVAVCSTVPDNRLMLCRLYQQKWQVIKHINSTRRRNETLSRVDLLLQPHAAQCFGILGEKL